MPDADLERRLRAVERALTGDQPVPDLSDDAELVARVDRLRADVDAVGDRLDELDAAVQAVRGYVGQIEHVNERVERRANAACAAVDRLESQRADAPNSTLTASRSPGESTDTQFAGDQRSTDTPAASKLAADQSPADQSAGAQTVADTATNEDDESAQVAAGPPTLDPHRPRRHAGENSLTDGGADDGDGADDGGVLDRLRGLL